MRIIILAAVCLGFIPGRILAQNWDTLATRGESNSFEVWTYVESYFAYDFNDPVSKNIPYLYNFSRHNEFNLNLALVEVDYQGEHMRTTVGLQTGTYPMANYSADPPLFQHIYQAFGGVQVLPDLWLDVGVFSSHFGIETALASEQWTLTRSLCSENSPYFETGGRLTYDPSGPWSFAFFVLNGWQNILDSNSNKALGTQIQYTIANQLTLNSSTFWGNEKPDSAKEWRFFHDFYALWDATPSLAFSGVFDIGWQQSAPHSTSYDRWYTFSLIGHYALSDLWAIGLRAEEYNDPAGVIVPTGTSNGYQTFGYSANVDYTVSDHAMLRFEGKEYVSKDNIFVRNGNPVNQSTVLTSSLAVTF